MSVKLNEKIKDFYDASSNLWEDMWGEHMHHGYYGKDGTEKKENYQAQIDLIEELLSWGKIESPKKIADLGCGIGGSALYLAEKYGAEVTGLTLSPVQAKRAEERAREKNLEDKANFLVADALNPPMESSSFDLVWTMESGEHMADKGRFIQKSYDLLRPGVSFLMATWCHREEPPALSKKEKAELNRLYKVYNLPHIISNKDYAEIARKVGFEEVVIEDWSDAVAPFWKEVLNSALSWKGVLGLLKAGWPIIKGAWGMQIMIRGYQSGLIEFGVLRAKKV